MNGVKEIDCRLVPNAGPVYGLLTGAASDGALWSIDLMTRDGYQQFVSSDVRSDEAVASARALLTGANGIVDKNCELVVADGAMCLIDRDSCWEICDANRARYVDTVASAFIDFLVTRFENTNYAWKWRDPKRHLRGSYGNIRDALARYHWPIRKQFGKSPYFVSGADYASNELLLLEFQSRLRLAAETNDADLALQICKDVQRWGGTDRAPRGGGNLHRLDQIHAGEGLVAYLKSLVKRLETCENTGTFLARSDFVSNAGFTKIYSLFCPDFVIYDSRVAAVLGAFLAQWVATGNTVDDSLKLAWMPPNEGEGVESPKLRDPSTIDFPLDQVRDRKEHFISNVRASWILSAVASRMKSPGIWPLHNRLRALEAALFTMGHDLSGNS
jgi:hypothetical protein